MSRAASITDVSIDWPGWQELWRTITLQAGFNSSTVIIGATMLGVAGGVVGTFAMLRRRAMMSDAVTHATLPGVAAAFLIAGALGFESRSLGILMLGAAAASILGILTVQAIVRAGRLGEDAAIGIVLSTFFGVGVVLLSIIQGLETGNQGGLKSFIYGQTAAMHARDAAMMGGIALLAAIGAATCFKELAIVCFDEAYARTGGWSVTMIDLAMMAMVVLVVVAGLQAVGLILVVAILIIPPAAARFWSDRLGRVVLLSGLIGGASGYLGATLSSLLPRMPAGAVIVLTAGGIFGASLLFAPRRGVAAAALRRMLLDFRVRRDHLLREMLEARGGGTEGGIARRAEVRSRLLVRVLAARGLVRRVGGAWTLTDTGLRDAEALARNHRLWERYLVHYADVAPSHVDWSADAVEHVLSPELVAELERSLASEPAARPGGSA